MGQPSFPTMDYSDSHRPALLMRQLQARYAFLGLLGRGGAGIVFEVENLTLKRREALKLFTQSFARDGSQRFAQEARIMAALDHPHIMPIYSFGDDQGCIWFAMRLVEGPTLARYLKSATRLDAPEAIGIALPLLEALSFTHAQGIVHRDIKPANVLLDAKLGPILTDFGIAKAESDAMQTETGAFLGTPAYISPEQGLGRRVDGRSDLYALGMVLYEMLAGRLPFDDGNSLAVVLQRFQIEAPSLGIHRPELPPALVAAIDRALARDPDQRFASAEELRLALLQAAESLGIDPLAPLEVPANLGPPREKVPQEWVQLARASEPEATVTRPREEKAPEAPPPPKARWPYWTLGAATVGLVATLGWAWANRTKPVPPGAQTAPVTLQAAPASVQPEPPPTKPQPRPQRESAAAEPIRRPVTLAQLLERPVVETVGGCAGFSASVAVQVDEQGTVTQARVMSELPAACREAALKASRTCRFQPALAADGKPVASTVAISIEL